MDKHQRQLLRKAFKKLEQKGLIARPNYLCCTTCASNAVAWDADLMGLQGGVYWHGQNEDSLRDGGDLYIGFVGAGFDDGKTAEVGKALVGILKEEGLDPLWDGDPATKVLVQLGGKR